MKTLKEILESSILDIDATFKHGDNLVKYNLIRELYYSSDRKTLNKNWNAFKKVHLGSQINPKNFSRGKLYIGASKAGYNFDEVMKTITYIGIIRGKENKIYMNQNDFITPRPFSQFDLEAGIIEYEPEDQYPIGMYKRKKKFVDLKGEFDKIVNTFEWYEVPTDLIPYVEKVILVDAEAHSSNWKIPVKVRRKSDLADIEDL
jgi:hypothetical protein